MYDVGDLVMKTEVAVIPGKNIIIAKTEIGFSSLYSNVQNDYLLITI